jgi:hypothetical protein
VRTLPPHAVARCHFCSNLRDVPGLPQTLAAHPPGASAAPHLCPLAPPGPRCFPDAPPPGLCRRVPPPGLRPRAPPLVRATWPLCFPDAPPGLRPRLATDPLAPRLTTSPLHYAQPPGPWRLATAPPTARRGRLLHAAASSAAVASTSSSTPRSSYRPGPGPVKPTRHRLHAPVHATSVSGVPWLLHDVARPPGTIVDIRSAPAGHPTRAIWIWCFKLEVYGLF